MNYLSKIGVAAAMLLIASQGNAATVDATFSGPVDVIAGLENSPVELGNIMSFSISFDTDNFSNTPDSTSSIEGEFESISLRVEKTGDVITLDPDPLLTLRTEDTHPGEPAQFRLIGPTPASEPFFLGFLSGIDGPIGVSGLDFAGLASIWAEPVDSFFEQIWIGLEINGDDPGTDLFGDCPSVDCALRATVTNIDVTITDAPDVAPVPLPASLPLLGFGVLALGWLRRKRRSA